MYKEKTMKNNSRVRQGSATSVTLHVNIHIAVFCIMRICSVVGGNHDFGGK
jgi:hypothetical protein